MKKQTHFVIWLASFGILFIGTGCQKTEATKSSTNEESTRVVVKVDQGPYIGVDQAALDGLEAYRSEGSKKSDLYHIGRPATAAEIAAWDIDIPPDGHGLPPGSGTVGDGEKLYTLRCAVCHGLKGEGVKPYGALVANESTGKTIGSFWPYATTIFDYIRRGMPFDYPGSLTDDEVYALTAYLLFKNEIIAENVVIHADSLPKIEMPNVDLFVPDDREHSNEVH